MRWLTPISVLIGASLIAASILFIGRWQISAIGFGYKADEHYTDTDTQGVYRIDRWTGSIAYCVMRYATVAPSTQELFKQAYKTGTIPAGSLNCTEQK
jgi:hypothetical protein